MSDEALRSIAGSSGPHLLSDADVGLTPHLLSDADVGLTGVAGRPKFVLPSDQDEAPTPPSTFVLPSDADQYAGSTGADVAKSAPSGISRGIQGLIGTGGDIRHAADYGMLWAEAKIAEKLGKLPPGQTRPTSWALARRARRT
jgi:hypothetical protein